MALESLAGPDGVWSTPEIAAAVGIGAVTIWAGWHVAKALGKKISG